MSVDIASIIRIVSIFLNNQMKIINRYHRAKNLRYRMMVRRLMLRQMDANRLYVENVTNAIFKVVSEELLIARQPNLWMHQRSDHWYRTIFQSESYAEMLENFRMDKKTFQEIVRKVSPDLSPHPRRVRESLSAEKKCAIAIYKLAFCGEYRTIGNKFGVHKCTVMKCLKQFCEAIIKHYMHQEISIPVGEEAKEIIAAFERKCNIPQIVGAIDGTHIPITPTADGYHDFVNSNNWPSLVMQAVVDSNYLFRSVACKHPGCTRDATVLKDSGIYRSFQECELPTRTINSETINAFIVGDPAYPLLPWLLTRYVSPSTPSEESFNAYLSKGRIVVEHAFARLKSRWRILQKKIDIHVNFVPKIVMTCCILHNIVEKNKIEYKEHWLGELRESELIYPQPRNSQQHSRDSSTGGEYLRDLLKNYMECNYPLLQNNIF